MTIAELLAAARGGSVRATGRLLSLVESGRRAEVLSAVGPAATRVIGVTGPPGAGKSTTIAALVGAYRERGLRVAVLAVDPSSPFSGGALLGDRIRMAAHINDPEVLIRSVAARGHLGGLAEAVPAAIALLAALGFDVLLLETVGVGQSEIEIAAIADPTIVVLNPGAGDAVQAAKAGLLEVADIVVVNKADGKHLAEARMAARELSAAIRLIYPRETLWRPPVLTMSAIEGTGLAEFWDTVERHRQTLIDAGEFDARRRAQQVDWTRQLVRDAVLERALSSPAVREVRAEVEQQVLRGELTPALAAQRILGAIWD